MEYKITNLFLWDFFRGFTYCTVHLYWMANVTNELHENFKQYISHQDRPSFSILQTRNSKQNITTNHKSFLEISNQTDLDFASNLYRKVFNVLRLHPVCVLELPILDGLQQNHLETYFHHLKEYRLFKKPNRKTYLADYVALLTAEIGNQISFLMSDGHPVQALNIIILSQSNNKMFVPCFAWLEDCWVGKKLLWIPAENSESARKYKYLRSSFKNKRGNLLVEKAENECPFNGRKYELYHGFRTDTCVKHIIAAAINCTSESFTKILMDCFTFGFKTKETFLESIQHYSSFGSQINGYRYSIFINKHYQHYQNADVNAFKLLSPLGMSGWTLLFATVLTLGYMFKATGIQDNQYFWLYAVILEQAKDKLRSMSYRNMHLVFFWLYACHLIRSQYTSSLYAHMTKDSAPLDIPKSFNGLVYKNNIILMVDMVTKIYFEEKIQQMNKESNKNLSRLLIRAHNKTWGYAPSWGNIFTLAHPDINSSEKRLCRRCPGSIIIGRHDLEICPNANKKLPENKITVEPECTNLNRFAWFYKSNQNILPGREHELSLYSKLLVMLFGEYIVIENNAPATFQELSMWHSYSTNYLGEEFNSRIGSLVESGIYAYQNHYMELTTQHRTMDQFLKTEVFNITWSKFSLVNQMLSKYTPLAWYSLASNKLSKSLINAYGIKDQNIVGTMYDFRYVWIFYIGIVIILILEFLWESGWESGWETIVSSIIAVYFRVKHPHLAAKTI